MPQPLPTERPSRRFRRLRPAALLLPFLLLPLAACGESGSGGDTVKIGVPVPLSGDSASAGQDILAAAKVAVAEVNKAGGVLGKQVELVQADDACSPQQGAQAAQKLLNSGVVAVAGATARVPRCPRSRCTGDATSRSSWTPPPIRS